LERPKEWDLAAAARISTRVEFRDIRLSEISASSPTKALGVLEPKIEHHCTPRRDGDLLEVLCSYQIRVMSGDCEPLNADIKYLISYALQGDDPVDSSDLEHFASANGTYHSWPFVRQLLFDLTARMGYPPYNLPVFRFFPRKPKPVEAPPSSEVATSESVASKSQAT
jgi:preprotein translocase subunit SecB